MRVHRKVLSGSTFYSNFEIRLTFKCITASYLNDLSQKTEYISFEFEKVNLSIILDCIKQITKYVSGVDFPNTICVEREFINSAHDHYRAFTTPNTLVIQDIGKALTRGFELFHSRRPSNWPITVR